MGRASLLPLLALVAVGCSVDHASDEEGQIADNAAALSAPACSTTRFIGPVGDCINIAAPNGTFMGSKLFGATVPGLNTMCQYVWSSTFASTPTAADLAVLPPSLDADCHVVSAEASPVGSSPAVLGPLHDAFVKAAGAASLPKTYSGAMPPAVRVAVVDSSPTKIDNGRAINGKYEHGFDVGRVVRELTCPSDDPTRPPCIGQIASNLALPLTAPEKPDYANGGYFGSQGDLAKAIVQAVDGWRARRARSLTEPARLVINLSLGWDRDRGYELSRRHSGYSWAALSVYNALRHASCRGALVIAAAGNRSGGSTESSGAMFPAAWEGVRAPTAEECKSFEGEVTGDKALNVFPPTGTYAPLLYAVGGVDAADRPLSLSRPTGTPRLVAHGAEVVTQSASSGYSNNFSGTSMSAAVVTAAATAAWAYAPSLAPATLMSFVRKGAVDLSQNVPLNEKVKTKADFCLAGQDCGTVTRVTVASAVAAVCGGVAGACQPGVVDPLQNTIVKAYGGKRPSWSDKWSNIDSKLSTNTMTVGKCAGSGCGDGTKTLLGKTAKPWVGPQPGKTGCDVCGLTGYGDFYLVLNDNWWDTWNYDPGPAYLGVDTSAGSFSYTMPVAEQTSTYSLQGIDPSVSVYSTYLSFSPPYQDSYATMEQVMYWP